MRPTVWIETTVPNDLTAWPSRDVVRSGEQLVTRDGWARRTKSELRASSRVLLECGADDPARRLAALGGVPILVQASEAEALAVGQPRDVSGLGGHAAYRHGLGQRRLLPGELEPRAHRQRGTPTADRGGVPAVGLRTIGDLQPD